MKCSGPVAGVDGDWPHIAYSVTLAFNDKLVLSIPFKLGIGHIELSKARPDSVLNRYTDQEYSMLNTWLSKPNATFTNKLLQAQVATKLAVLQKVFPTLPSVLHSLLTDGEAFTSSMTFEDWCGNFGYETDSRKAEDIYRTCDDIGRKLSRGIPADVLTRARELLQDY